VGLLGALGCTTDPATSNPRLTLRVAPLTLPDVRDACFHLWVTNGPNGAGDVVWRREHVCSTQFGDGAGGITYVGTCDAGAGAAPASVVLQLVDVWTSGDHVSAPGGFLDRDSYQNPCGGGANDDGFGACAKTVTCVANADTFVAFDLTLVRDAGQGFFDVAVDVADVFCSAKFDCAYPDADAPGGARPIELLFAADGERHATAVLGLACTSGDRETHLYLDDLTLACDGVTVATLSPAVDDGDGPGNQRVAGTVDDADSDILFQWSVSEGVEALGVDDDPPFQKLYWTVALGFDVSDLAGRGCRLTTAATASEAAFTPAGATPPEAVYPMIVWDVPLERDADGALACGDAADAAPLRTEYVQASRCFDNHGFVASGRFESRPTGCDLDGDGDDFDQLVGDASTLAALAIPDLPFDPARAHYAFDAELGGPASTDALVLRIAPDTTVAEVNALLAALHARIGAGFPAALPGHHGFMVALLPTTSHAEMRLAVDVARSAPGIASAIPDTTPVATVHGPDRAGPGQPYWDWSSPPNDDRFGSWGMKLIGAPRAWNLVAALRKLGPRTKVGIGDEGFDPNHPDLDGVFPLPGDDPDHGTHVAGIIAARHDDVGVEGVDPFAQVFGVPVGGSNYVATIDAIGRLGRGGVRVFNYSMGSLNPALAYGRALLLEGAGNLVELLDELAETPGAVRPVLVGAAGNDGLEARWNSEICYPAMSQHVPGTYCVENIAFAARLDAQPSRASTSNFPGNISGPGVNVESTLSGGLWGTKSGTSMAAPHVTGTISFLFSVAPGLTVAGIDHIMMSPEVRRPVQSGAASYVDLFDAVLMIDTLRPGDHSVRMLVDVDDGTVDGNTRIDHLGVVVTEDARGDGQVDMRDFRRFRDWLLQAQGRGALDGAPDHVKRDLDGDGAADAGQGTYPRGDFNGDDQIHVSAARALPGFAQAARDLDVLSKLFSDPNYGVGELPALIDSADLHAHLGDCFRRPEVAQVIAYLEGARDDARALTPQHDHEVFTVPAPVATALIIEAIAGDGSSIVLTRESAADAQPGSDVHVIGCAGLGAGVCLAEGDAIFPDDFTTGCDAGILQVLLDPDPFVGGEYPAQPTFDEAVVHNGLDEAAATFTDGFGQGSVRSSSAGICLEGLCTSDIQGASRHIILETATVTLLLLDERPTSVRWRTSFLPNYDLETVNAEGVPGLRVDLIIADETWAPRFTASLGRDWNSVWQGQCVAQGGDDLCDPDPRYRDGFTWEASPSMALPPNQLATSLPLDVTSATGLGVLLVARCNQDGMGTSAIDFEIEIGAGACDQ